jgi:hypothetical protein
MYRLRITCLLCATFFLLLPTGALAADPSVVVTPGGDGTVNVLAQCAPVEEVLAVVAQAEGSRAEFSERLRSLVTLSDASAFKSPEQWIYDINTGLNVTSSRDGATWRFSHMFPDRYDPTLTASEILIRYASKKDPELPTDGVRGAVLVLHGQYITPPYGVTIAEQSGVYRIDVNSVQVSSITQVEKVEDLPLPSADMPGFQLRDRYELYRYTYRVLYPTLRKSMDVESPLEETARFLRSQDIVEEVAVTNEHPRIWMTIVGSKSEPLSSSALPVNYDLDTDKVIESKGGDSPQERAESKAEVLRRQLSQPALVVLSTTGMVIMPGLSHLQECAGILRQANELDVLELECALTPLLEDRQLAREVAANAVQSPAPLLSALDNLIEQKQVEILSQKDAGKD